jgi:hypothetical protein
MSAGPTVTLDAADAVELADALQWLRDWFASDPDLARSMRRFSFGLVTLADIDAELAGFAFTLGQRP